MALRKKRPVSILLILAVAACLFSGCGEKDKWKKPDVSGVQVHFNILRFEQDLFRLDPANLAESELALRGKYGRFYDDYILHIMNFGRAADPWDSTRHDPHIELQKFLTNPPDRALYDSVQYQYRDLAGINDGLGALLKHYKFYFPASPQLSRIITMITEFGDGIVTYDDSTLCIGLDMYLGSNYPFYQSVDLPQYMIAKLKRPYILPNVAEAMYNADFDKTAYNAELPLIEALVNEGKKYYFMECMLPEAPDSLLIGYSARQEEWCRKSEKSIWQFLNERDLLFKVNYMEQKRYTSDGPGTTGMPPEAPPKVGSWVGWQIVRKFMRDSGGKVTLPELLNKYTAKQVFTLANYKPK